ncbi:MAG: hypothetical protein F4Y86_02005 [Gammaproteobacteria bacterium]|nr:hypothetical protein [Gammaproteobacteria bacterium]
MPKSVTTTLATSLRRLGREFKPNRLAYLSLTASNEALLCGALASLLHEAYADQGHTQVRREWSRSSSDASFDVAVLTDGVPVALIEAKAAMSFDLVQGGDFPKNAVLEDLDRLKGVDFEGERYALLFVTHPHEIPRHEYDVAMPTSYTEEMRRHGAIEPARVDNAIRRFHGAVGNPPLVATGRISAGTAFDVDVSIIYLLVSVPG